MKLIQIEGPDCSFKDTITNDLYDIMKSKMSDINVHTMSSIVYTSPAAYYIKKYLNGDYGSPEEVSGFGIATAYALHRYDTIHSDEFKEIYKDNNAIILTNRWTGSNIVYQSNNDFKEAKRIAEFEHTDLKIPVPDLVITLEQDFEIAKKLIQQRESTDKLESDFKFLKRIYDRYYDKDSVYNTYLDEYVDNHKIVKVHYKVMNKDSVSRSREALCTEIFEIIMRFVAEHKEEKYNVF